MFGAAKRWSGIWIVSGDDDGGGGTSTMMLCCALSTRIHLVQFSICVGHSWLEIFLLDDLIVNLSSTHLLLEFIVTFFIILQYLPVLVDIGVKWLTDFLVRAENI